MTIDELALVVDAVEEAEGLLLDAIDRDDHPEHRAADERSLRKLRKALRILHAEQRRLDP